VGEHSDRPIEFRPCDLQGFKDSFDVDRLSGVVEIEQIDGRRDGGGCVGKFHGPTPSATCSTHNKKSDMSSSETGFRCLSARVPGLAEWSLAVHAVQGSRNDDRRTLGTFAWLAALPASQGVHARRLVAPGPTTSALG
jgi:hypothetical protein